MAKVFIYDHDKCNGCRNCQLACKDEHAENDWLPYAKAQPLTGQFWLKLEEHVCGTRPKVRIHYTPHLCGHCERPACRERCPVPGAVTRRPDGLVLIDPALCDGCGACMEACPYGVIYKSEALGICQKCTGCAHLLDHRPDIGMPRCVEACPTGALGFGEAAELDDFLCGATVRLPEAGLLPQVYYRNIPGRFIAGTVYDPIEKEVVIGARCRLAWGNKVWETATDNYGDFWFNDLAPGRYELVIRAQGFAYKTFTGADSVDAKTRDVNLGDIALERE